MRQLVCVLGTPVDILNTGATLDRLEQFIAERRFHQVATANADFLVKARFDADLRRILRDTDLVTPDGMPLVWVSRKLGGALPERVTGADIVPALAGRAAQKGYRLYMLGARPDVAQKAKARLEADFPGVQIVGCVSPPVAPLDRMDHESLLADIAEARPDILLVAFGNPKQEKWIAMHRDRLDVPLCIGVGGTFDFIAGEIARAPDWMKRSGLEWSFRMTQEPRRLWKRYAHDLVWFARDYFRQKRAMKRNGPVGTGQISVSHEEGATVLRVMGTLESSCVPQLQAAAQAAFDQGDSFVLDMRQATGIDSRALGTLLNLPKWAANVGREVRLAGPSPAVRRILQSVQAGDRLPVYDTLAEALNEGAMFPGNSASLGLIRKPASFPF